ncbi:hypothetical protein PRZ48_006266 [Zasmidium cellare]|uniref:Homeobox domain-containing protein n=1 Tax=Zasmidium cellare TaxID=395010 RepID=A0ABR0ENM3_ZASCE|nr:hypothetical protein PRZ48_006266 [Zasmidium cellare]
MSDDHTSLGIPGSSGHYRRDSGNANAPHSPPYRLTDEQKPSLPPLKTVLGDNISSPPRTPSPHESAIQPSPREPSYTALTYKPPALYPNKKQRTEPALHSAPAHLGPGGFKSSYPPSATLEPRPYSSSLRPQVQFPPLSAPITRVSTRRPSDVATSPPWGAQYPTHAQQASSSIDAPASHYQTPEQTPTSSMVEPSFPRTNAFPGPVQDPFAREMRESFARSGDHPASRRGSTSNYSLYPSRPYEREAPRAMSYQQGARHSLPVRGGYADAHENPRYGRPDELTRPMNGYGQPPYQGNMPAFFMPSHYEYQHGKARKRSNLPKQSTEIMKTWFDQNITNPYPSEEQKAIFSNATGISMTQVSNWFINHRRRCPELRDKRDKGRMRDVDV